MVFVFVFVSVCLFAFCLLFVCFLFVLCFPAPEKCYSKVSIYFPSINWVRRNHLQHRKGNFKSAKMSIWKISDLYPLRTRTQYQASEPCYTKYSAQKPAICQKKWAWFYLLLPLRSLRMLQAQWICLRRPCLPKPLPSCPSFFWLRELVKPTSCLKRKVVLLNESADVAAFFDFQDLKSRRIDRFQSPMITPAFVGTGASSS